MDQLPSVRAVTRTRAQHRDTRTMRVASADAPAATPIEGLALRDGVWSHVVDHLQSPGAAPVEFQTMRTLR